MSSNSEKIEHVDDNQACMTATQIMTWEIPDFSELAPEKDFSVVSNPFSFENATWRLRLYPNAMKEKKDYVGFKLERSNSRMPHHKLHCNVMIQGEDIAANCLAVFVFDEYHEEKEQIEFICPYERLADSQELYNNGYVLTLKYQVFCEGPSNVDCFRTRLFAQDMAGVECLCRDFKDLLVNGKDHDVILKVKGEEFDAHQSVLRARSPVFKSMLSHEMVEKNSGVVDIPDCDPYAFKQFLIYLYCGQLETLEPSNMLSLYYLADKYDVGCLKKKCHSFAKTSMSCANVCEVIQLAMNHNDAELLERATDYFVKNVNRVLPTVGWQCFIKLNPIQANELFIKAAKAMSGEKV